MRFSFPTIAYRKIFFSLAAIALMLPSYSQSSCCRRKISDQLELIKLTENSWMHISYIEMPPYGKVGANGLLFIAGKEAFLFDSPWNDSLTCQLVSYLSDSMALDIKGFVPNHWHADCMGGLACLQGFQIPSYANQITIDSARSRKLPVPDHGFSDSLDMRLGDRLICCFYPGAAHSTDNIVVWLPSEKLLFAGCMVKSTDAVNLGNTADGDLKAYPSTIEKVMDRFRETEIIVPGHGSPGGTELFRHTLKLAGR